MVKIALRTKFKQTKGSQTAEILYRVYSACLCAQLSPLIRFTLEERDGCKTSAITRVLKRFPEMKRFDHTISRPWGLKGQPVEKRRIGNDVDSPMVGAPVELSTMLEIAAGVPRRYPFFNVFIRVTDPAFGDEPAADTARVFWPGIAVEDGWGSSRRRIALSALAVVEANIGGALPPTPADAVTAALNACGPHSPLKHVVLPGQRLEASAKAAAIESDVKTRMAEIIKHARLPNNVSADKDYSPWPPAGSRKPALVDAFRPLGYEIHGEETSTFVCSRRTASNLIVRLRLDLGTWRMQVESTYSVYGLGFAIAVGLPVCSLPVSKAAPARLDQIRWQQVAENLAALVAELDRSVIPSIEEAVGATPAWYEPESAHWARAS